MLRNYTAYFVVNYDDAGITKREAGFYPANTFGEAMDYIEEFYGKELCWVERLELLDSPMMIMSPDIAEKIADTIY